LDRVTLSDEVAAGGGHSVLGERGPARDDPRVVGVTRRTGVQGAKEIPELALVESDISEKIRFGGCRRTHGEPALASPRG
jgi:hypothetical protein